MPGIFELKRTNNGQFMFNLRAGNGEIILTSPRYKTKEYAEAAIGSVRANAPLDARYDRRTANPGEPYFVLKTGGGEALGRSELYSSGQALENGIASVQRNAPDAHVRDLSVGLAGAR
ncbi:MAG: YegP family protein [Deltaproteobacteria bacterium]